MKFTIILGLLFIHTVMVCCKDETTIKPTVSTTTEVPSDFVQVYFMDFKRSEFLEVLPKLKSSLLNTFNDYCNSSTAKESGEDHCDLRGVNATQDMFKFDGKDDKEKFVEDNRYVIANMYIEKVDENDVEKLPVQFVRDFLINSRNKIAEESGVQIAFVDKLFVYPKRNNLDNYIIIPISCAVFLALFIINFVCSKKVEKRQKEDFLKNFRKPPTNIVKRSSTDKTDRSEEVQLLSGKAKYSKQEQQQQAQYSPKKGVTSPETPTNVKRKKLRGSKDPNYIAGNANERIGSTHHLAQDDTWAKNVTEQRKEFGSFHNNFSIEDPLQMTTDKYKPHYVSGDVSENQLKRNRNNNRNNYEYPDPRVAQRLASYERLPSTYDNMRVYEPFPKPKNSGSTRKVDI